MWIPKSEEELIQERKKDKSIWIPLFISIVLFITLMIQYPIYEGTRIDWWLILFTGLICLIVGFLLWGLKLTLNRNKGIQLFDKTPTVICIKCNRKKTHDGNLNCECGGQYEFIKNLKWIDE